MLSRSSHLWPRLTALLLAYWLRTLGRDTFGAFGLIQGAVGMFGVFAGMGLGITATKYIECRISDPAKASRVLSLVLLTSRAVVGAVSLAMHACPRGSPTACRIASISRCNFASFPSCCFSPP